MIAAEPQPVRRASTGDPAVVLGTLRDAVGWWLAKARLEPWPGDRLWVCFQCAHCATVFDRVLAYPRSPSTGGGTPPLYREMADLPALLEAAMGGRPPDVDAREWQGASECACGAPGHHRRIVGVALLHVVMGSGAALVASRVEEDGHSLARVADGSATMTPLEPSTSAFEAAFGRPFALFDGWARLLSELPVAPGTVVGTDVEHGVLLFAAANEAALAAGVASKLRACPRIVVRLDAATAEGPAWPAGLRALARVVEEGTSVAMVVERDRLLEQARVWARSRLSANVRDDGTEWVLGTETGDWPISPLRIVLLMIQHGRTLAEACAHELTAARDELRDRVATLAALTELVPGSAFDVEGGTAYARLSDGRAGQTLELTEIPAGAGTLPAEVLAREAAFLFDVAPPWADRLRVCPCGAAAGIERRLVSLPWPDDRKPWVLRIWGSDERPQAAEVVALCCDRHVRIPSEADLRSMGLDEQRLVGALDRDVPLSVVRVEATRCRADDGSRAAIVRGPLVASVVLSDARLIALARALDLEAPRLAWAVGSDVLALMADPGADPDAVIRRALAEIGMQRAPFWIRQGLDPSVEPRGSFDVVMERG